MPLISPFDLRWAAFEAMEPRLMLAVDAALPMSSSAAAPADMEMHLPGSISGGVYAAPHGQDIRQASDTGITGVRIELLNAAGEVLAEAVTDDVGAYEFPALAPGTYAVRQIQPAGWLDGFELLGSGGGSSAAPNVITQIVVQPGDTLVGYDFAEIAAPVQPGEQLGEAPSLIGWLPPLVVSWSRPVEPIAPPSIETIAPRPLPSSPQELRPAEPIFGGSSRVLDERDAALEAFTSEDEVDDKVARRSDRTPADSDGEQQDRDEKRLAVRDRAFASQDVSPQDVAIEGSQAADEVARTTRRPVVARRPASSSEAAKKPAA